MAHGNKYWLATQKAAVPENRVPKRVVDVWVKHGGMAANSIRMLNGAFEIWHLLRTSIALCEDGTQRAAMLAELEDAGDAGWGVGVADLDDAFEHWLGPGDWTDDNWGNYTKASGIFGSGTPGIKGASICWGLQGNMMVGPKFAVNFFDAMDKRLTDLKSAIAGHNDEVAKLASALANKNGKQMSDSFHAIAQHAGKASKLMFLAPKMSEKYSYYGKFVELKGGSATGVLAGKSIGTFLGAADGLDKFLSVHDQALRTGIFDNQTATALAALTVALNCVPVLGGFYSAMVEKLPSFFASFKTLNEDYYRMNIDQKVQDATYH